MAEQTAGRGPDAFAIRLAAYQRDLEWWREFEAQHEQRAASLLDNARLLRDEHRLSVEPIFDAPVSDVIRRVVGIPFWDRDAVVA